MLGTKSEVEFNNLSYSQFVMGNHKFLVDVISQEKQETPGLTLYSEYPF